MCKWSPLSTMQVVQNSVKLVHCGPLRGTRWGALRNVLHEMRKL